MVDQIDRGDITMDRHIARSVRELRILCGMSQASLGAKLGLTCGQIQKYEYGHNRIYAGRLWLIAESLNVPVALFFDSQIEFAERAYAAGDQWSL